MKLGTLGIRAKLFLAVLAACAAVLAINGIATRISFERSFLGYLNEQGEQRMREVVQRAAEEYRRHGNWDFLRGSPERWFELTRPTGWRPDLSPEVPPPVSDQTGVVLRLAFFDAQGQRLFGNPAAGADAVRMPVVVDGQTVGTLAMVPFEKAIADGDVRFYEAWRRDMWLIGVASVLVAALLAWGLSRALLGRLRTLTGGIHQLAAGDYATRIAGDRSDELGQLMRDVNRLADVLEHTEQNRREFMADISHELRTPLAVLRAELEALQDGIRPLKPESLAPLQGQVHQLGQLIDDLHEVSVTQSGAVPYRLAPLDLAAVLSATLDGMRGRIADAGLTLHTRLAPPGLLVLGEERRLQQLFANLLENAARYTDRGGQLHASVQKDGRQLVAVIEDSAPGVPADRRARLFERFYRADPSRSRASGGSGLGLAICRNIATAHDAKIVAEDSALGGLRIVISFPLHS